MKIAVVSDTHGDRAGLSQVLTIFKPDVLVHLGDGYGDGEYASHAFPQTEFHMVCGNCDVPARDETEKLIVLAGKRFLLTHGHRFGVKTGLSELIAYAAKAEAHVVFYGHTHIRYDGMRDNIRFLNPGSASTDRRETPSPSFAMVEIRGDEVHAKFHELIE